MFSIIHSRKGIIYKHWAKPYGSKDKQIDKKISEMLSLREKYSSVKPENKGNIERHQDKVEGLLYTSLIDDNNQMKYKINWNKVLFNTKELLSLVNLTENIEVKEELKIKKPVVKVKKILHKKKEKEPVGFLAYFIIGIIAALTGGFIYKRVKK